MDNLPYTNNDNSNQFVNTLEAFGWLMFINILWRRAHRHAVSGIILVICLIAGFLSLVNSDYGSNGLVWVFWACFGVGFICIAKLLSR